MATGQGLIPVRHVSGGKIRNNVYYVPSTDSTALYVGDPVKLVNAMDPENEVSVVTAAAAGDALIGAVVGFLPDPSNPYSTNRKASTNRYVLVCDDPDVVFQIQEDAVGGAVSAANVASHDNADIVVAAGSDATGVSGAMLDSSSAAVTSAQLKIIGIKRDKQNAAADSAGAVLEVLIHEHALKADDSIT